MGSSKLMKVTLSRMSTYCMKIATEGQGRSFESACKETTKHCLSCARRSLRVYHVNGSDHPFPAAARAFFANATGHRCTKDRMAAVKPACTLPNSHAEVADI